MCLLQPGRFLIIYIELILILFAAIKYLFFREVVCVLLRVVLSGGKLSPRYAVIEVHLRLLHDDWMLVL